MLSVGVRRALREAAERVVERMVVETGRPRADITADVLAICDQVAMMTSRRGVPEALVLGRHFNPRDVIALRVQFVATVAASRRKIDPSDLVGVLVALDTLSAGVAPPAKAQFGDQLAQSPVLTGMLEIAHDMRSPLAAILLLVEPIRRGKQGPVTPAQERQLGIIYGAALSLSTLANDIIEAGRSRQRAQTARHPFSIRATFQDACAVVRPIAEEKRLEFVQTYPVVDGRIGNAASIHRVLLNLTSNALKYTEQGSVTIGCIELDRTRVEFFVQDTGTGIPARVLSMLESSHKPGTGAPFTSAGLGLAICRSLLEAMGSSLKVETSPDRGTRFSFVLDLEPAMIGHA